MRKLAPGVFLEHKYSGVHLGAVVSGGQVLLVDTPIRSEDGREWAGQLAGHGRLRFVALLDAHPDRALGARAFDLPLVAHDLTRERITAWPDTFKGGEHLLGSEVDRLKRVSGLRRAIPDLTFSQGLRLTVGEMEVELWHRPGPTAGAAWLVIPTARVVFVGDCIWLGEPPYLGEADIRLWRHSLSDLRSPRLRNFQIISGRNGQVPTRSIAAMDRTLSRIEPRLRPLGRGRPLSEQAAAGLAAQMMRGFRLPASRRPAALLRLQNGLMDYQRRRLAAGG